MVMADRMLQMRAARRRSTTPSAERVARRGAPARRRRHERHRARDRRRGRRGAAPAAEVDGQLAGPRRPRLRERRVAPRRGGRAARRHRSRHLHGRHPADRVGRRDVRRGARARSSTSTSPAPSTSPARPTRSCARVRGLADGVRVELVHPRPARLRRLLGQQGGRRQHDPGPRRGVGRRGHPASTPSARSGPTRRCAGARSRASRPKGCSAADAVAIATLPAHRVGADGPGPRRAPPRRPDAGPRGRAGGAGTSSPGRRPGPRPGPASRRPRGARP